MTVMENRTLMWQADLDQELQKLTQEISHVLGAASADADNDASDEDEDASDDAAVMLWRQELRQMRCKLVETLKLLINSTHDGDLSELLAKMKTKEDASSDRQLRSREIALRKREEALLAKEKKFAEKLKAPSSTTSEALLAKEKELLDFKEKQLQEREQALQREKQLQQDREHSFHAREKLLLEREVNLQTEKKLHQERDQFLQSKERQQQEREETMQAQKKLQQEREEALDAMERRLDRRFSAPQEEPEAPKARRQPKRKAEPPAPDLPPSRRNGAEAAPKDRSSRSRERVLPEEDHPKTKRRRAPYLTFEELRWDWRKSQASAAPAAAKTVDSKSRKAAKKAPGFAAPPGDLMAALKAPPATSPTELPWDTDLMVELDEVAPPSSLPPSTPPAPAAAELPWDTDLMVELDDAEATEAYGKSSETSSEALQAAVITEKPAKEMKVRAESPPPPPPPPAKASESFPPVRKTPAASKAATKACLDPSYAVDDLEEEDLFGEDEAEARYVPPSEMSSMPPPQRIPQKPKTGGGEAEKSAAATAAGGAAKNKKRDWYQRHYPGQVAPRETASAVKSSAPRPPRAHVATPSWRRDGRAPGSASAASGAPPPRSSELDWAYAPLKGQQSQTHHGFRPPSSDGLPSIDDVLPML